MLVWIPKLLSNTLHYPWMLKILAEFLAPFCVTWCESRACSRLYLTLWK